MLRFLAILLLIAIIVSSMGWLHSPNEYAAQTPVLDPATFFNGRLQSWGIILNASGKESRRFTMDAEATWEGDRGEQREHLHFTDGTSKERLWHFVRTDEHHFTGTADDVAGVAHGENYGNALHWVYDIKVATDAGEHVVTFDDWLYLVDETHLFSKVKISKWGFPVGEMTMFFIKAEAS